MNHIEPARPSVQQLRPSLIRKLANTGIGLADVIPLWFGEPDQPTPEFIREAAKDALDEGNTYYQPNAGLPVLREAIRDYMNGLYDTHFRTDNIIVTASGMMGVMLAGQCVVSQGDTIVTHAPTWPNLPAVQQVLGAQVVRVPLRLRQNRWYLDLDELFDACSPNTRALLINSPANPTGWMLTDDEQRTILEFCRARGLWLIADEVYNRIIYDRPYAPTFADKISDDDRVLIVNSFSKTWAMTGWRLGWLTAPSRLLTTLEMLTEFSNSCVLAATQVAGVAALQGGEPYVKAALERYRAALDVLLDTFEALPRVFLPIPQAAFYAFFSVEGVQDSFAFAQQALEQTRVGLAPGVAFGPEGERYLRLCFAAEPRLLEAALERLRPLLV
ncbi:MAG TPA: pyridoxal phosphate-dependent aminotransferase [Spirillospora sp.]|nr:pyridoxal phosphate-dependent aminotransferase [Spirillospora sp.]